MPERIVDFKRKIHADVPIHINSAWLGMEQILDDLMDYYNVGRKKGLEFGVEFAYSTIVLSRYFEQMTAVDIFDNDGQCGRKEDERIARFNCEPYPNINLIKGSYQDFIKTNNDMYDLIHIDIVHTFEDTYACGKWAIEHAPVVLFHDTESWPGVKEAVAALTNENFDNFLDFYGLGIVTSSPD